jgi:hypothetical protein
MGGILAGAATDPLLDANVVVVEPYAVHPPAALVDRDGEALPTQVFYDHAEAGRHLIRFAFCKRDEVLNEAVSRLRRLATT